MTTSTFKSFAAMSAHIRAESARAERAADMRRAANLRRSQSIANVQPGKGPRVAR